MLLLMPNTIGDLLTTVRNEPARMILAEIRQNTSIEKAHIKPKLFQLRNREDFGAQFLHKLLCFILRSFQDSLKITTPKNEMSPSEIFDAAGTLMEKYSHESIHDILMALKLFEESGKETYNAFSKAKLLGIMTAYLETKADFLERNWSADTYNSEPLNFDVKMIGDGSNKHIGSISLDQLHKDYTALNQGEKTEAMKSLPTVSPETQQKQKEHDFQLFRMKYHMQQAKEARNLTADESQATD